MPNISENNHYKEHVKISNLTPHVETTSVIPGLQQFSFVCPAVIAAVTTTYNGKRRYTINPVCGEWMETLNVDITNVVQRKESDDPYAVGDEVIVFFNSCEFGMIISGSGGSSTGDVAQGLLQAESGT